MYNYMHTFIHTYIHTYIHTCMHADTHTRIPMGGRGGPDGAGREPRLERPPSFGR